MPSGAKKRKAAKKRKEKEAQQTHNNHDSRGNDGPRSHDERESDGSVASPASHNSTDPFRRGNEESNKRDSPVEFSVKDNEPTREDTGYVENSEKSGLDEESVIRVEREMKLEEKPESSYSSSEQDKSSSSSSDDDESRATKEKPQKGPHTSAFETVTINDVEKPAESLPEKTMEITGNAPLSDATVNAILETVPVVDPPKPTVQETEQVINIEGIPHVGSVAADAVKPNLSEEEVLPPKLDQTSGTSSKEDAGKILSSPDENANVLTSVTESSMEAKSGEVLPSSAPAPEPSSAGVGAGESKIPESSKKEPPSASTHPIVQRTSWLNCCGLLDVITGSGR